MRLPHHPKSGASSSRLAKHAQRGQAPIAGPVGAMEGAATAPPPPASRACSSAFLAARAASRDAMYSCEEREGLKNCQ